MTPCPDIDRLLDAVGAGMPGAMERLDAHAATCETCAAEAALADEPDALLEDALACLRSTVAPVALVEAALAAARAGDHRPPLATTPLVTRPPRAGERPALRGARRPVWRWVAASAVAVVAVVVAVSLFPNGPSSPDAPLVAQAPPSPSVTPDETPQSAARTIQEAPERPVAEPRVSPEPAPASPAVPASDPPAPPESAPLVPESAEPDPTAVASLPLASATPTPADSAFAREGVALALALVGRAQRTADEAVSTRLQRVSTALEPTRLL